MTSTRQAVIKRQAIFKHILTDILEIPVDEEIWTLVIVVEKCRSITDFVSLDRADFEQPFQYTPPGGGTAAQTSLSRTQVKELLELQLFIKSNIQDPTFDWMPVTPDDFDLFRVNLVMTQATGGATTANTTATATSTSTSSGTMLTARKALFQRRMHKRRRRKLVLPTRFARCKITHRLLLSMEQRTGRLKQYQPIAPASPHRPMVAWWTAAATVDWPVPMSLFWKNTRSAKSTLWEWPIT
jgi:hypothetical protein